MPVTLTKAQLNKILVAERAKSQLKHKQSAFMTKTRNIYSGQETRLREDSGDPKAVLPYTLEELRTAVAQGLERPCCYCHGKLTVKSIAGDHATSLAGGGSWSLKNLVFCCQKCNWEKSILSAKEFRMLLKFLGKYLSPESATNVKRRLTIGGKWSPR